MTAVSVYEVFTPNDTPSHTYVKRIAKDDEIDQETLLRRQLKIPKVVISLSGPSKSGKTVLMQRTVGQDNLIHIYGAGISKAEDIWDRVLNWMGSPSSVSASSSSGNTENASFGTNISGSAIVLKGGITGNIQYGDTSNSTTIETRSRSGIDQVVKEISNSEFIVFIDDFHYIPKEVQPVAARQIKEAAERGVRICTASVPHRADDVVRGNSELLGRLVGINFDYWSEDELASIAINGFNTLNVEADTALIRRYAAEAAGSPQLMQSICLDTCIHAGMENLQSPGTHISNENATAASALKMTATRCDYSTLVKKMHDGPKTRGQERKEFYFKDRTTGDVYRALLLSMAQDPPRLDFSYNELVKRIATICTNDAPVGSSVQASCIQIAKFSEELSQDQQVVEWDQEKEQLDIVTPYFLFYLRSSGKLASLGKPK